MIPSFIRNIENNYLKYWNEELEKSEKLHFYKVFNHDINIKKRLDFLCNTGTRKTFVKFITSNHNLHIEKGRHCRPKIPREDRVCNFCPLNETEDEMHFLFYCPHYDDLRKRFIEKQNRFIKQDLNNFNTFCHILFHTDNKSSIQCTARYIYNCLKLRDT